MKEIIEKFKRMPFTVKAAIGFLTLVALSIFAIAPFVMGLILVFFGFLVSVVRILHYLVEGQ